MSLDGNKRPIAATCSAEWLAALRFISAAQVPAIGRSIRLSAIVAHGRELQVATMELFDLAFEDGEARIIA